MVEIPEHLLKRSRERRAALGLGGGETPSEGAGASESAPATTSESAATPEPAPTPAAPPEPAKPEPPKPLPAYVQAAQRRRRIPFWAMPVLAGIPIWAYVFFGTLSPQPNENDPLTLGGNLYNTAGCVGCHGASGQGGAGPAFAEGAVIETFRDFRDQMMWVRVGADGWPGNTYGETNKAEQNGSMPAHESLTGQELAQIVLYERRTLGGEEPPPPEEDQLLQIASGELTWAEVGVGPASADAGFSEVDIEEVG